jgi:NAD(P)-dependent dehydrogenase (short-subunit alcohol dehydrogenase family)
MPTVLITGANRGLGLEFARQYATAGWRVYAACRAPDRAKELLAIERASNGQVSLPRLEVEAAGDIERLAGELRGVAIDVLINNAGIGWPPKPPHDAFGKTNYDDWAKVMAVNVLAPMRMSEAFVEHVARSDRKVIAMVSSRLGSIAAVEFNLSDHVYRTSKAALNMLTKMLSHYLRDRGIIPVALAPGWVRTDMGGSNAALSPEESIGGMRQVIERLRPADAGGFFNHQGETVPW